MNSSCASSASTLAARLVLRAWAADLATPAKLALPAAPVGETFVTGKATFTDVRL